MAESWRTLLITGAAGGIGRATVELFAASGWKVIGVDRSEFGEGFPANGLFIQSDISEPRNLEYIYEHARGFSACLDAVIRVFCFHPEQKRRRPSYDLLLLKRPCD